MENIISKIKARITRDRRKAIRHFIVDKALGENKKKVSRDKRWMMVDLYENIKKMDKSFRFAECNGTELIIKGDYLNAVVKIDNPAVFYEIFADNFYDLPKYLPVGSAPYSVIDMGANRGFSVLLFGKQPHCRKVYAFEPVASTYNTLLQNIKLNPDIETKVVPFNYGLGDKDEIKEFFTLEITDSVSTTDISFIESFLPTLVDQVIPVKCEIKQASSLLREVLKENQDRLVIKIDVEGAEYAIFEDLAANYPELFRQTDVIFAETHLGFERLHQTIKSLNLNFQLDHVFTNGNNVHMLTYIKQDRTVL